MINIWNLFNDAIFAAELPTVRNQDISLQPTRSGWTTQRIITNFGVTVAEIMLSYAVKHISTS